MNIKSTVMYPFNSPKTVETITIKTRNNDWRKRKAECLTTLDKLFLMIYETR